MTDHSYLPALHLVSACSCLSLAMRLSRSLRANPPTRIPSICPGAHMGLAKAVPLGSCPWSQIPRQGGQTARPAYHKRRVMRVLVELDKDKDKD